MKTKIEIESNTGSVLFEYEKENNTIKETLVEAIRSGADLRDAYLGDAYLGSADLRDAYLGSADLRGAYLCGADLCDANLRGADLRGANLRGADLCDANLFNADLGRANLFNADLGRANLRGADLSSANLWGANLGGADLRGADLCGAYLDDWGRLSSPQDILTIGLIGSRDDYTTIYHTDKGIYVQCGCFSGTLDEFVDKVKETHNGTKHERDYLALVEFAKIKFEL